VKIYRDYGEEPEDCFQPLSEQLARDFYDLEMDSCTEDISFYRDLLPPHGLILELGCGSGRLSRHLATRQRSFVGIDISLPCLNRALGKGHPYTRYAAMDMAQLGFTRKFNAIVAAYNTLNLLPCRRQVSCCLESCRALLYPGGTFLAQLYCPPRDLIFSTKKSFQFQIFDRPGGGRVIKEILKQYEPRDQTVRIEERYRVRPMQPGVANEDWSRAYSVAAFDRSCWLDLFSGAGFGIVEHRDTPPDISGSRSDATRLLVHLRV
jgi:SAM-dependent methyltransferase